MYYPRGPLAAIKVNLELWGKTAERQLMFNGTVNCSLSPSSALHPARRSPLGARRIFNTGLLLPRESDDEQRRTPGLSSVSPRERGLHADERKEREQPTRNSSPRRFALRPAAAFVRKADKMSAVSSLLSDKSAATAINTAV